MPFGKKFSVPKMIPRKAASLSNLTHLEASREFDAPIRAHLGDQDVVFQNGDWHITDGSPGSGYGAGSSDRLSMKDDDSSHSNQKNKRVNQQLVEENQFLKLKVDIILNMLAEVTATVHLQENEIDELKVILKKQ